MKRIWLSGSIILSLILVAGCEPKEKIQPVEGPPSEELSTGEPMDVPAPPVEWTGTLASEQLYIGKSREEVQTLFKKPPVTINGNIERYELRFPEDYDYVGSEIDLTGLKEHKGIIVSVEYSPENIVSKYSVYSLNEKGDILVETNDGREKRSEVLK